jgi:hypothetical protein
MLFGEKIENSAGCRSRVVHQNIDAPQRGECFLDKSRGIGRLSQISRYGEDFAVCLACNLRRRCLERLLATRADRKDRLRNPDLAELLLKAATALAENGTLPPGAEGGEAYGRMRGGYFSAPETRGWPDVYHLQLAAVGAQSAEVAAE